MQKKYDESDLGVEAIIKETSDVFLWSVSQTSDVLQKKYDESNLRVVVIITQTSDVLYSKVLPKTSDVLQKI